MDRLLYILHLEDDPLDAELIKSALTTSDFDCEIVQVSSREEFTSALDNCNFDLILADYSLITFDGSSAMEIIQDRKMDVPFMYVSGTISEDKAVSSLKNGATDYILKHRLERLLPSVERVLRDAEDRHNLQLAEKQLKISLQEKEVLLQEIHHRVKNNMAIVASFLELQIPHIKDPGDLAIFKSSQSRIYAMALIHENMYKSDDFSLVNLDYFIRNLSQSLLQSYSADPTLVSIVIETNNIKLNMNQSIPCGLIINELLSNTFKYAFTEGKKGNVRVTIERHVDDQIVLTVSDDGIGLPKTADLLNTKTLGLTLVSSLTEQLNGNLSIERASGTEFIILFRGDQCACQPS